MPESALSGIPVIDLSQGIAGPYCSRVLREVLQGLLDLSDEEVGRLEEEQVIGSEPVLAVPQEVARQLMRQPLDTLKQMGAILDVEPDYLEQLGLKEG